MTPRLLRKIAVLGSTHWNWSGKIAAIAVTLLIYACLPRGLRKEAGILSLPKPPEWKSVAAVSLGLLTFLSAGERSPSLPFSASLMGYSWCSSTTWPMSADSL